MPLGEGGVDAEDFASPRIDLGHDAFGVDGDQAIGDPAYQSTGVARRNGELVHCLFQSQLILDGPHGGYYHAQRVRVGVAAVTAEVDHSDNVAERISNWSGRTGKELIFFAEMFPGVDLDRGFLDDRGTDRICSPNGFTPSCTG